MPQEFEPSVSESVPRMGTPGDPAMQRVTPEELHAALDALEGRLSRPLAAAGTAPADAHVPDTLSLGEAADALSLSIPPEELWREVQQQRAQKEKAEQERTQREQVRREQSAREHVPPPFQQVPPLQAPPILGAGGGLFSRPGKGRQISRRGRWIVWALAAFAISRVLSGHGHGPHIPTFSSSPGIVSSMSAGHNLTLKADAQNYTVNATGGVLTVKGDAETITVNGTCDGVIVSGDADTVHVRGSVKNITFDGDANTVTYPASAAPLVNGDGSANSAHPE